MMAGGQAAACVLYYGMPEMDEARLKTLAAPVLGIFAEKDEWISPKVVAEFKAAMRGAKRSLTVKSYKAAHAFANPSNPRHDKTAAEDANRRAVVFLKQQFAR